MNEVATCPRCNGEKMVDGHWCRTCDGSGVVWRPTNSPQESASSPDPGADPTELRGV